MAATGINTSDVMESTLINRYQEIFSETRDSVSSWAVHKCNNKVELDDLVRPTIPFVGKNYASQNKRFLVYASAENLIWYLNRGEYNELLNNDDNAFNRHRVRFENDDNKNYFYPNVHISPMNDGSLCLASTYMYLKYVDPNFSGDPKEYLERITFGNFVKFTIEYDKDGNKVNNNKDAARDENKLNAILRYIDADLRILEPDYILMMESIYYTAQDKIQKIANEIGAVIIPIKQINARTINCQIRYRRKDHKRIENYPLADMSTMPEIVNAWYSKLGEPGSRHDCNRITGKTYENYKSVFTYLDTVSPIQPQ